jgi:hypothetical protein
MVEIDQMAGTRALKPSQTIGGAQVSLDGIYQAAGFPLRVVQDQQDVPRLDEVRLADLHGLMLNYRSKAADPGEWRFYALIATKEAGQPDTLGIMFDFGDQDSDHLPREAFAVFADSHEGLPAGADPELLLTTAHELAHCFNIHHPDWEGAGFYGRATVESYSSAADCVWSLSAKSRKHITTAPLALVMPGAGGLQFGTVTPDHLAAHQPAPPEDFDVVDPTQLDRAARGKPVAFMTAARGPDRVAAARTSTTLALKLAAPKSEYVVGEPVVLTAELSNKSAQPVKVSPLLDVSYHFLQVLVRGPNDGAEHPFRPILLRDARKRATVDLEPDKSLIEEIKVFFGADGWTFATPGQYTLAAEFQDPQSAGEARLRSEPLVLTITEPASAADRTATARLKNDRGRLSSQAGLFLTLEGGDHLTDGAARVRAISKEAAGSALAPAARLALGVAALHPTIPKGARVAPPARIDEAKELLTGIIDANLAAPAVARATEQLARELDKAQRKDEASEVRRKASDRFKDAKMKAMLERVRGSK